MHLKGLFLGSLITVTSAGTTNPPPLLFAAVKGSKTLHSGSLARVVGNKAPLFSDTVEVRMDNPQNLTYDAANYRLYVNGETDNSGMLEYYQSQSKHSMTLKLNQIKTYNSKDGIVVSTALYEHGKYMVQVTNKRVWRYDIKTGGVPTLRTSTIINQQISTIDARQIIGDDAENPKFFLVIDYGSKMIHSFQVVNHKVQETPTSMKLKDGIGSPKKGIIVIIEQQKFLCLIADVANSLIVYKLVYQAPASLNLVQTDFVTVTQKVNAEVTDIVIGKNNPKFFLTTVKGDPVDKKSTIDPVITWSLNKDGKLSRIMANGATGLNPKHAAITDNGDLLVLSLGAGNYISVLQVNPETGVVGTTLVDNENIKGVVQALVIAEKS